MRPAQLARTLASSLIGGVAQVAWSASLYRVRHALDSEGRPLLLCRTGGALDRVLCAGDVATVITVAGCRGRVWISGWAMPLLGDDARAGAMEFAARNPLSDLLDVGNAFCLYRLDVAEVRLEHADELIDVDVDDYASAVSEPVT
ncbi:MAG TPA: hypothetical protein DGG94_03765 [Micromonosporaceae bacterium]|nr:hypothetical protein [Micromonosporaceae bacterium]HCU48919.1 hypothetical protein [Micromonosporaceae bacterium]